MEEQPLATTVTVATGALGPVLDKLTALLGEEQQHRSRLCSDMESITIRSKLASLHSLLLRIWERGDLGAECKEWMTEVRAQSYDMEDDIDDIMHGMERSDDIGHGELINKLFQNFKMKVEAVSRRCHEEWKATTAPDEAISVSEKRRKPSPADPRARFLHMDSSELVGMDRPFSELQQLLRSGDHEMVCIHGFAGTGKTTLADLVYQSGDEFECRAFVSLSKSPDMLEVLGAILAQVTEGKHSVEGTYTEETSEQILIHDISEFLSDKRYLVIVDDIWEWQSWEIIRRALPKGNRHCRIIATTRVNAIAEKCSLTETGATIYRHSGTDSWDAFMLSRIILQQKTVFARGSWWSSRIADMCGGMTLAVWCLSAAVASYDYEFLMEADYVQPELKLWYWYTILLGGLHSNAPTLAPMVESLRLGYDDLPVHVKTCLLYCSIFPTGYMIKRHVLLRKWITHGFFPRGPEQEKEAAAEACLDDLVSRGLLQQDLASSSGEKTSSYCSVHPMMRAFLLWRSKEASFTTCLELPPHAYYPPSYAAAAGGGGGSLFIGFNYGRLGTILAMHGSSRAARSLVVFGYPSSTGMHIKDQCLFPWERMERVRALSIEDNSVPLCDTDLVAICRHMTRLKHLGLKGMLLISVIPPEIGRLQNLENIDISDTSVREVPKEVEKLNHLKTLNVPAMVRELPWCLCSSSVVSVLACGKEVKLPRGISAVVQSWKKKHTISVSSSPKPGEDLFIVLYVHPHQYLPVPGLRVGSRHIRIPEWIKQHLADVSFLDIRVCKLEQDDLEFLSTMPNLQHLTLRLLYLPREPTILTGTAFSRLESFCLDCHHGYMRVPGWVKQHLANVSSLDIGLCQLVDDDLDFLSNKMHLLQLLTLRLEVLPKEAILITGEGFKTLKSFCLDCRLPIVTFQQGSMPKLEHLEFKFYTSRATRTEDPMGIRHLLSLKSVVFQSSPRYKSDAPGISVVINKVREEAKEHPNKITISINGKDEEVIQDKKEATTTSTSASDMIPEENIVTSGGIRGSSGASMIKKSLPFPYDNNGSDNEKGNIIPVKSYYPFGVTK